MEIRRGFSLGRMNKEVDNRFLQDGEVRHAENLRFHTNGGKDGSGYNIKGTTLVADLTEANPDFKCVGGYYNENLDTIYFLLATTTGVISKICEYNVSGQTATVIAHDNQSILNLQKNGYITGIDEIDGLLYWAEWGNNPRRLNIERAKTWGLNGFTEDDVMVMVKPPMDKLKLTLQLTDSEEENYLEEKMLAFSYQYRYLDGEYSALAPFTEFAFYPEDFSYDFSEQSNRSMVNRFNSIEIEFNTGNERVTEIRLVFKEAQSNTEWIIDDFNKAKLEYGDNVPKTFVFTNNKRYRALPDNVLRNYFNNVPLEVKSQAIIDGRLIYGYYKEGYNLLDSEGETIEIDFSLNLIATTNTVTVGYDQVPSLVPLRTAKSIRDYEVGVIYTDAHGRATVILVSKTNTINIPITNSVTQNQIQVELNHNPPAFATHYRFFIKPSRTEYDQILPTLFYEDGVYRWVKLEGADKDKIKEGDILIVKADSTGILQNLVKVKVLEIKNQEKNFLQPDNVVDSIKEKAGLYFKIRPRNFYLDLASFETYEDQHMTSIFAGPTYLDCPDPHIDNPHFYGDTLDDLSAQGTFTRPTGSKNRYAIEIDGELTGTAGVDTFRWSDDNGQTWTEETVDIVAGVPYDLNYGVQIIFSNDTGHSTLDNWRINARAALSFPSTSLGFFRFYGDFGTTMSNPFLEEVPNGATISLVYESGDASFEILNWVTSDAYDNIQEWYFKENIFDEIYDQDNTYDQFDINFVKGVITQPIDSTSYLTQNDALGITTMVISKYGGSLTFSETTLIKTGDERTVIFETEGKEAPNEIFHEIGKTYQIVNNLHAADLTLFPSDQHQTSLLPLKATLDWFNAYSYGNSVESYKIKDEFNKKGLDTGIRVLTTTKDEYKEVIRKADLTWSDIYEDELSFNGLSTFNLSQANFTKLDQEEGSIQKLINANGNLLVFQEDAIGVMPYNKNIIYDTQGGSVVGITTNVLDKKSYRPYADGVYGTSNPESIVMFGNRKYFVDRMRGILGRLSTDGITPVSNVAIENYFSNLMTANKNNFLVGGYDPKHSEYLISLDVDAQTLSGQNYTLAFKEGKGFPNFYTFKPDFMLYADKELYLWKNGKMYIANSSETRNNFFGTQYSSKLTTVLNDLPSDDKIYKTLFIESSDTWDVTLSTNLANGTIDKDEFIKKNSHYFAYTRRNENTSDFHGGAIQGLGIIQGFAVNIITLSATAEMINVGSEIYQINGSTHQLIGTITNYTNNLITITQTGATPVVGLLCYEKKNARVEGGDIRGYYLEATLENDSTEAVEIFAIGSNVIKTYP